MTSLTSQRRKKDGNSYNMIALPFEEETEYSKLRTRCAETLHGDAL
jgi:hypothetical protein